MRARPRYCSPGTTLPSQRECNGANPRRVFQAALRPAQLGAGSQLVRCRGVSGASGSALVRRSRRPGVSARQSARSSWDDRVVSPPAGRPGNRRGPEVLGRGRVRDPRGDSETLYWHTTSHEVEEHSGGCGRMRPTVPGAQRGRRWTRQRKGRSMSGGQER